ncbi:MAG: hypothetical protein HRU76_07265 [Phycisphaeraceae bacterium]|nr:hypothetical protein [Phycisphaerales bacterium]QOJ17386.1 MAG: hypothetical protein HRU76_07265 [Phycisphaeraceae bacterium]
MDFAHYDAAVKAAAARFEQGDHAGAAEAFIAIVESDISDLDKAMMSLNVAVAMDKMGRADEALSWFDVAIGYEQPYCRVNAVERKAAYLHTSGNNADSLALYEWLADQPYALEHEKERFRYNVSALRGLMAGAR